LVAACGTLQVGIERSATPDHAATTNVRATDQAHVVTLVAATATALRLTAGAEAATDTPSSTVAPATPTPTSTEVATNPPSTRRPVPSSPTPTPTLMPPLIISFTVSPSLFSPGDTLTFTWEAQGERATLCPRNLAGEFFESQCLDLPPQGTQEFITGPASVNYAMFVLTVRSGGAETAWAASVAVECSPEAWFFETASRVCPSSEPINSAAAAQRFEGGRMMWVQATDEYLIFFDGGGRDSVVRVPGPLTLVPGGSPDNRVGEAPPPGRYEPVSGFGLIWRGEVVGVQSPRDRLGWARELEFGFSTTFQCKVGDADCYLRTPEGGVLYFYFYLGGYFWETL
jgi:hypothetical protein